MPRFGLRLGDAGEQAPVAVCVGPVLCQLSGLGLLLVWKGSH